MEYQFKKYVKTTIDFAGNSSTRNFFNGDD